MTFARTRPEWEVSLVPYEQLGSVKLALRSFKPDGIICARLDEKAMALVASLSLPTAIAFHPAETKARPKRVAYVMGDGCQMGRAVARHMYSRGYRSFLCVGRFGVEWENERFSAFEGEMDKFGCPVARLEAPFSRERLVASLEGLPPRSAVFAADDVVAADILNIAKRERIDVPRRFGVMGVSNFTALCDNSHPPLTSIDQNFEQGGYLAAKRLHTMLSGGIVPEITHYPPGKVHERESLPQISARHSLATDLALAFIARNVASPIEVPDVVSAAGVSRRSLENLFRSELSSSVAAEIRNARLGHLAEKVACSDAPIANVCLECGWPYAAHAMRLFKHRFGYTIGEWRRKNRATLRA